MGKTIIKRPRDTSTQLTRDLTCRRFETRHRNPSVGPVRTSLCTQTNPPERLRPIRLRTLFAQPLAVGTAWPRTRNIWTDQVVASLAPIGSLAYLRLLSSPAGGLLRTRCGRSRFSVTHGCCGVQAPPNAGECLPTRRCARSAADRAWPCAGGAQASAKRSFWAVAGLVLGWICYSIAPVPSSLMFLLRGECPMKLIIALAAAGLVSVTVIIPANAQFQRKDPVLPREVQSSWR